MYGTTNRPYEIHPIVVIVTSNVTGTVVYRYGISNFGSADILTYAPRNNFPSLPHRYTNDPKPFEDYPFLVPKFRDLFKGVESRRDRSLRMGYDAIRAAKVDFPEPLPERLYHRPKRKGRACGSRYRVLLP